MKQVEIAHQLGVSKSYISMVLSGKKKASKRIVASLNGLGVNQEKVNFETGKSILSHARLPIPTLPRPQIYQNYLLTKFLTRRRQGLSRLTIAFYETCLKP